MDNHIIDQWAKDEMAHREIKPSASVWDRLESELNTATPPAAKTKKYTWFWMGMLSAALFTVAFYMYPTSATEEKPAADANVEVKSQNVMEAPITQQNADELPQSQKTMPEFQKSETLPVINKTQKMPFIPAKTATSPVQKQQTENKTSGDAKTPVKVSEIFAYHDAQSLPEDNNQSSDVDQSSEPGQEIIKKKKSRIDAGALLAQVDQQTDQKSKKYNIDPNVLLKEAEKGANERFLQKMVKTLSNTSTAVVAAVNNRNTEL